MIAGLLQYVVLNGDGSTTGVERLAPRLGTGRVGELPFILGGIELTALDRRLVRELCEAGIVAERRRGDGEGNGAFVITDVRKG